MIKIGDSVTARLAGAMRGATVVEVYKDKSILVNCPCPKTLQFKVSSGKYQDSDKWNNPKTRMVI